MDKRTKATIREVESLTAKARKLAAKGDEEQAVSSLSDARHLANAVEKAGFLIAWPTI
jgi:hypothetical protein